MSSSESLPHIVLVGAGHAHLTILQLLRKQKLQGVRVTLVSERAKVLAPLMFPYIVAKDKTVDEATIDVKALCEDVGVDFVEARAVGLDLSERAVLLDSGDPLAFRLISLNVGSRPAFSDDPSVREFACSVKPYETFVSSLDEFLGENVEGEVRTVVVVGGGKIGVELAFALLDRLQTNVLVHLVHARSRLLQDFRYATAEYAADALEARGVVLHLDEYVTEARRQSVVCESGLEVPGDIVLWAAHPEPAIAWAQAAGLAVDEEGFMLTRGTLQSTSHTYVFGVGECATNRAIKYPRSPRLGMRQGEFLFQNFQRWMSGKPLLEFRANSRLRDFVYTGRTQAIAEWGKLTLQSGLIARLMRRSANKFVRNCMSKQR